MRHMLRGLQCCRKSDIAFVDDNQPLTVSSMLKNSWLGGHSIGFARDSRTCALWRVVICQKMSGKSLQTN